MKKLLSIILIAVLCLTFCEPNIKLSTPNGTSMAITGVEKAYGSTKTLSSLVKYLKSKKLLSGNATKMDASLIGGKSGVKYSNVGVELYEYDTKSKTYKSIIKTKKVVLKDLDMEIDVAGINGKFIIIFDDNAKNKSKILKAFKAF